MKKICLLALSALFATSFAQPRLEYDIHYGFGASEMGLNNVVGAAAAIYPFTKNFGLSVGVEYSSKEKKQVNAILEGSQRLKDDEGDILDFKYRFYNHEEARSISVIQIPILLRYSGSTYYASCGMKLGIPQTVESKTSYSALAVEGYYPGLDYTFDNLDFQGFGRYPGGSFKTTFDSDILFMLALEYGTKIEITDKTSLMLGIFVDRSLNDGFDKDFGSRVEREPVADNDNTVESTVNKMAGWKTWSPWTIGVQLKIAFMH